jgi:hypothetical protein
MSTAISARRSLNSRHCPASRRWSNTTSASPVVRHEHKYRSWGAWRSSSGPRTSCCSVRPGSARRTSRALWPSRDKGVYRGNALGCPTGRVGRKSATIRRSHASVLGHSGVDFVLAPDLSKAFWLDWFRIQAFGEVHLPQPWAN